MKQLHVVEDLGQGLVGVRRHDDDLDLLLELADAAHGFDAVATGGHPDVDVGHRKGTVRFPACLYHFAGFLPARGMGKFEFRGNGIPGLRYERRCQIIRRPFSEAGGQHLLEVVVNLLLIVDDQHAVVPGVVHFHDAPFVVRSITRDGSKWMVRRFAETETRRIRRRFPARRPDPGSPDRAAA